MPQFGSIHDDSVYFVGAKAWATGEGHRIISLPGQPWQTKYPPLYPLFLSLIWLISPQFPQNLGLATMLSWLLMPPLLLLARRLFLEYGFSKHWAWGMVALLAINPYSQLFSISLLSEVLYTLILLGVFLLSPRFALFGGVLAGIGYLTRTAALPLLIAMPACFALRRDWLRAMKFACGMFPLVLAWTIWSGAHRHSGGDPYLMYYVDYAGYQGFNVGMSNLLTVLSKNIPALLNGMSAVIVPAPASRFTSILATTVSIGMIVGTFRLARDKRQATPYVLYGVISAGMLVVWHYPPNGRFLFPVFPLLIAGLAYQAKATLSIIRMAYSDPKQKRAAIVFACILAALLVPIAWNNFDVMFDITPAAQRSQSLMRADDIQCAARIRAELPPGANIMAPNDPTIHLMTGRSAMRMTIAPKFWYEGGHRGMLEQYKSLPEVARKHGMTHLYANRRYHWELPDEERKELFGIFARDVSLRPVFQCGAATVYEIR